MVFWVSRGFRILSQWLGWRGGGGGLVVEALDDTEDNQKVVAV